MVQGVGSQNTMGSTAPDIGGAVLPSPEKKLEGDANPTDPKFGEVWQQIQAKYGAKPEKAREIKKTLGKDDFLRIMITQMKHQDPTQPFKAEQFAQELAQFTSVEQMQNMNQSLTKMANQNQPLERLAMTNLIGKTVTVDRERFPHTENENSALTFNLPRDARSVRVSVLSESGEQMLDQELGPQKAGEGGFTWDGKKANTLAAKTGNYIFRVVAVDDRGASMNLDTKGQTRVVGVSFEGTEAAILVGDPSKPDKVLMRNITRIETDSAPAIPGVQSLAAAALRPQAAAASDSDPDAAPAPAPAYTPIPQAPKSQNFVAFQKGVGSTNLSSAGAPPAVADAVAKYQQQLRADEKGFPNGLSAPAEGGSEESQKPVTIPKGGEKR